jgi:anti-sigma factor RsiW
MLTSWRKAYVDDELSPEKAIDLEVHVNACDSCAAEVELTHSLSTATRLSVTEVPMCPEFRARLCQCVTDERKRQESRGQNLLSWKVIAPLAAAAAMALFYSYGYERAQPQDEEAWNDVAQASSQDNLVDALVKYHSERTTPEAVEPTAMGDMEPKLGFPVRAPDLDRYGAHFEGANLLPMKRTRAAVLRYNYNGRRVTLYMYDPEKLPLHTARNLQPRVIGNQAVFVGSRRGYSIATSERHGVGYAVMGELTGDESAELVASIWR